VAIVAIACSHRWSKEEDGPHVYLPTNRKAVIIEQWESDKQEGDYDEDRA